MGHSSKPPHAFKRHLLNPLCRAQPTSWPREVVWSHDMGSTLGKAKAQKGEDGLGVLLAGVVRGDHSQGEGGEGRGLGRDEWGVGEELGKKGSRRGGLAVGLAGR